MTNKAVIGLGFGDEGKGLTTDYLCSVSNNPLVIRFSGGQQAGHTVVSNSINHVFSNFGSGTLQGVPTYWSKYCTMYPPTIEYEYNLLKKKCITPKLYIDAKCPVTTPYDLIANSKLECVNKHGSCLMGINTTMNREEKHYSLLFEDLFYPSVLKYKLDAIESFYGFVPKSLSDFLKSVQFITQSDTIKCRYEIPTGYDTHIFEGSQGLLLDPDIGFFPHVTRIKTDPINILKLGATDLDLFLVTRAYQTRHGNGPMTNTQFPHNIRNDIRETNVSNSAQGDFRKTLLDLDLLKYGMNKSDYIRTCVNKNLVITCLDHVVDEYRFTNDNVILSFSNKKLFVGAIGEVLGISNIYISETPCSYNIKQF